MTMGSPKILEDELFQLLRAEQAEQFNQKRGDTSQEYDLSGTNLARINLRGLNAENLNLQDVYFSMADLRGIDFRKSKLEGASFRDANISGCYFPKELSTEELLFSIQHGTRVRYNG